MTFLPGDLVRVRDDLDLVAGDLDVRGRVGVVTRSPRRPPDQDEAFAVVLFEADPEWPRESALGCIPIPPVYGFMRLSSLEMVKATERVLGSPLSGPEPIES